MYWPEEKEFIKNSFTRFNLLEIISMIILIILFIFVNDRKIITGIPFLAIILYGMLKNENKRKIINQNLGILGAILFIFGLSFSEYSSNRGNILMMISFFTSIFYYGNKKIEFGYKKITYMFILIFILGIIWTCFSYDGIHSIRRFINVNKRFIDMFLLINIIKERKEFLILEKVFLFCGGLVGGYYIYDYIKNLKTISMNLEYRFEGFKNIAYSAGLLMMVSLYVFGVIWNIKSIKELKEKYYYIIVLFLSLSGLLLTKTRAAILGFLAGVIFIVIMKFSIKNFLLLLLATTIVFTVLPKSIKYRVTNITIKKDTENMNKISDKFRRVMWKGSIYTWENNKIFGVGASGTKYWVQKYADENIDKDGNVFPGIKRENFTFGEAHSIYLNILAEMGIFSILYFIQFFIFIPILILKNIRDSENTGEKLGASSAIIGYFVYGIVWSVWGYYGTIQSIFQFMLFILMFYYIKIEK
ncbi:O-antigen ligase family protein [Fusobacterium varium]|uniref:O-antigen ligase family protein n=1 Tax=Fusobacterium varium TaxID=856 RepID=UPI00306D3A04